MRVVIFATSGRDGKIWRKTSADGGSLGRGDLLGSRAPITEKTQAAFLTLSSAATLHMPIGLIWFKDKPLMHHTIELKAHDLNPQGGVFCPSPQAKMQLWSSHPKVYLDVAKTGQAACPYCGTVYKLKEGEHFGGGH